MDKKTIENNLVREYLRKEKIKLWLEPYFGGDSCKSLKDLALRVTEELKIPENNALGHLTSLQKKSIQNLKEREEFQTSGIACLKVQPSQREAKCLDIKISLKYNGQSLKEMVASSLNTSNSRIKLICKGKVIKDEDSLEDQKVEHGAQVMCLLLGQGADDLASFEKSQQILDKTKRDVRALAGRSNPEGDHYFQIEDQSGKIIDIPAKERKALVMAMTLHEKGRSAVKKSEFDHGLVLLLEAEKLFSECTSSLLDKVDNYGLLSLDIAWCYLNLKSMHQLPNAESRLRTCQQVFKKSYGEHHERLVSLKGTSANERALFLRLNLLQGIVFFHLNKTAEAREMFAKVASELSQLKVDEEKLNQLVEQGYTTGEARLGLREGRNDIEVAKTVIENKKAERKAARAGSIREKELKRARTLLGKCEDGNWIEPDFHKTLISMGFRHFTARWALAQSNNRISDAVTLIQEHPELIPSQDDEISQITSMGFSLDKAIEALQSSGGDMMKAVEMLSRKKSSDNRPGSSRPALTPEEENEAYKRIADGISKDDEDYLDLELTAEEEFLKHYLSLLD